MGQSLIRLRSLFWNHDCLPGLIDLNPKAALNVECHPNEYMPSLQMQPAHRQACCSGTESIWCVLFHCLSFPEVPGTSFEHKIVLGILNLQKSFTVVQDNSSCVYFLILLHYTSVSFLRYSNSIYYQNDNFFLEGYTVFITFLINQISWLCG